MRLITLLLLALGASLYTQTQARKRTVRRLNFLATAVDAVEAAKDNPEVSNLDYAALVRTEWSAARALARRYQRRIRP